MKKAEEGLMLESLEERLLLIPLMTSLITHLTPEENLRMLKTKRHTFMEFFFFFFTGFKHVLSQCRTAGGRRKGETVGTSFFS